MCFSILTVIAKDAARRQRFAVREQANVAREHARAERERVHQVRAHVCADATSQKESGREAKQRHVDDQTAKVTENNTVLTTSLEELSHLLEATLSVDDRIAFDSLRLPTAYPAFTPPAELTRAFVPPCEGDYVRTGRMLRRCPPAFLSGCAGISGGRPGRACRVTFQRFFQRRSTERDARAYECRTPEEMRGCFADLESSTSDTRTKVKRRVGLPIHSTALLDESLLGSCLAPTARPPFHQKCARALSGRPVQRCPRPSRRIVSDSATHAP
jgi:hypothetical protein